MNLEVITLGGGCFWCIEAVLKDLKGVERVVSGYAGGTVANPSYEQVVRGSTGHAEVVQVYYDTSTITTKDLLRIFFTLHNPTTKDRQGQMLVVSTVRSCSQVTSRKKRQRVR